jgi:hypothetical protein
MVSWTVLEDQPYTTYLQVAQANTGLNPVSLLASLRGP